MVAGAVEDAQNVYSLLLNAIEDQVLTEDAPTHTIGLMTADERKSAWGLADPFGRGDKFTHK